MTTQGNKAQISKEHESKPLINNHNWCSEQGEKNSSRNGSISQGEKDQQKGQGKKLKEKR